MKAASFCWENEKVWVGALLQIETEIEIETEYVKSLHTTRKINEFVLWKQKTGEIWKIMQLHRGKKAKNKSKFWEPLRKWDGMQRIKSVTEEAIEERNHVSNAHSWKRITD